MPKLQLKTNDPPIYSQLVEELQLRTYQEVLAEVALDSKEWSAAEVVAAYDWEDDVERDDMEEEDDNEEIDDDEDDDAEDDENEA